MCERVCFVCAYDRECMRACVNACLCAWVHVPSSVCTRGQALTSVCASTRMCEQACTRALHPPAGSMSQSGPCCLKGLLSSNKDGFESF